MIVFKSAGFMKPTTRPQARSKRLLMPLILFLCLPAAQARDLAVMMKEALANGTSTGIMTGMIADQMTQRTGSAEPIRVEIRRLQRFRQAGCGRVEVKFQQDKVKLPDAQIVNWVEYVQANLCQSGEPARDTKVVATDAQPTPGLDFKSPLEHSPRR